MKPLLTLMLLAVLPAACSAQYLLLQSGFSDGSARSTDAGNNYYLEQASGLPFSGLSQDGANYFEAGGLYPVGILAGATGVAQDEILTPTNQPQEVQLQAAYPNPGRQTTIKYGLPKAGRATLKVYNILGGLVRTLEDGDRPAGWHELKWSGRDNNGRRAAAGIYLYRLTSGSKVFTKKLIVLQ
jgi:hypothetical protein